MYIEYYITLQIIMVASFFLAYYTRQLLMWSLAFLLCCVLLISSFGIQIGPETVSYTTALLINLMFFLITIWYTITDIFDKYGN